MHARTLADHTELRALAKKSADELDNLAAGDERWGLDISKCVFSSRFEEHGALEMNGHA